MRLAEAATVSNFERPKSPCVGVAADSVINLFFAIFACQTKTTNKTTKIKSNQIKSPA